MQTHMRTHKESSIKYECRICKMKFNAPKLLEKHMKTHDIGNNEQNAKDVDFSKCIVCCEYAYEPHMCGEEKQIDCGYCLKKYTSTKELLAHLDTHNKDIKIYRCVECFKNFRMEILLKIHQKYHAEHPINKSLTCPTYSNVKLDKQMVKSLSNADSKKGNRLMLDELFLILFFSISIQLSLFYPFTLQMKICICARNVAKRCNQREALGYT